MIENFFKSNYFMSEEWISFVNSVTKKITFVDAGGKKYPVLGNSKVLAWHPYTEPEINHLNKMGITVFFINDNFEDTNTNYRIVSNKTYDKISKDYHEGFKKNVRRSTRFNLNFVEGCNLDDMLRLNQMHMKDLGSTPYPRKFLDLLSNLPSNRIFSVEYQNKVVSFGLGFEDSNNFYFSLANSDKNFYDMRIVYFLYDKILKYCSEKGLNVHLGMGLKGQGSEIFKDRLGALRFGCYIKPELGTQVKILKLLNKVHITWLKSIYANLMFKNFFGNLIPFF